MKTKICSVVLGVLILSGYGDGMLAATLTVITPADSGAGSLRQAILDANASSDSDVIAFAIPGTGP
ncbi:MAG: hypothetical protein L0Z50_25100, partial [Verrucomicrobiales bacterium]|nr:hypothetical protein [Verrucomicrobiales bacterium]